MDLTKTKERLKKLIDENESEDVLNEVRNILELASEENYILSDAQKQELDLMNKQHNAGELKGISWEELKQELIDKLKK